MYCREKLWIKIGLLLFFISLFNECAFGELLTVCKEGCDFSTIEAAVGAANPGDVVEVQSGIYQENVLIKKGLTLRGKDNGTGKPVIDAGKKGSAVRVLEDNVTIEGFNLTNARGSRTGDLYAGVMIWANGSMLKNNQAFDNENGILIKNSADNSLENNYLQANKYGIMVESSQNITIDKNEMRKNTKYGLLMVSSCGNLLRSNVAEDNDFGIKLDDSENNTLLENQMKGNSYNFGAGGYNEVNEGNLVDSRPILYSIGAKDRVIDSSSNVGTIYCLDCRNITIQGVNLSSNFHGIYLRNTTGSVLEENNLINCSVGISLIDSNDNIMRENRVNGSLVDGLDIIDSDYNRIDLNRLEGNKKGLLLLRSGYNEINGNLIRDGDTGAQIESSWKNVLSGNTLSDNYYGIRLTSSVKNSISKNNITNNWAGIYHDESGNNTIDNLNLMLNNTYNESTEKKTTAGGIQPKIPVRIVSEPENANVLIDGKPKEETTPYDTKLEKGSHNIELRLGDKSAKKKMIVPDDKEIVIKL